MTDSNYQAIIEVRYGIQYNAANERLFRRLKLAFDFASLLSGTAAFGAAMASMPGLAAMAGVSVAALAIVNQLASPGEQALKYNEAYRRFTDLDCRAASMSVADIRAEISTIRAGAPWGVDALGSTAYNRTLLANGHEDGHLRLSGWQRFVGFFA